LEKFSLARCLWGDSEVFTRMKKNQETDHTILLEILNGTRPLTEDGIRALVQEDLEIAVPTSTPWITVPGRIPYCIHG
jgi:hypothetical protein